MNTRTENRPHVSSDRPSATEPLRSSNSGLSLAQTIGGSLAAATAAALGSQLGFVGTISGAAVASIISAVAGAVYTNSLKHTSQRVSSVLRTVRGERPAPPDTARVARRVLVGAVTVFAIAAVGVTGFEAVAGRSLDGAAGGTTVGRTVEGTNGGSSGGPTQDVTPTPASTPTTTSSPTETFSPSPSAPSPTATASEGSGSEATPDEEPSPTSSPSDGASVDASPTAEPTGTSTAEPTEDGQEGAELEPLTP